MSRRANRVLARLAGKKYEIEWSCGWCEGLRFYTYKNDDEVFETTDTPVNLIYRMVNEVDPCPKCHSAHDVGEVDIRKL